MRFVFFADLHLDSPFAWLGDPAAARRRRESLRATLRRIAELARAEKADALLCGGDLFEHDRCTPDTASFLRSIFADLHPMPVFLAPGNHDWCGPASFYARTEWTPNVHVFEKPRFEPVTLADGLTLWGAGHDRPALSENLVRDFRPDRDGVHLALFHGSEIGWLKAQGDGKMAHAPFSAPEIEAAGFDHAFVGHYHNPRHAPRFTYPGNPDPLAFGEEGVRGAVVATVRDGGGVDVETRSVAVTAVHDLEVDVTGCANRGAIQERVTAQAAACSGLVRITLLGELAPEVDLHHADLQVAAAGIEAVAWRIGDLRAGYDLAAIELEQTVRGQFVRDVRGADLDDDERRRVLLTGLRALDGRDDLEAL